MSKNKKIYAPLGATNHSKRERAEQDYYATHPSAINHLFEKESFTKEIWEPACGGGALSKRMEELGKDVYSTDLIDRGYGDDFFDFLETDKEWDGDIITNPPYKLADKFVRKALETVGLRDRVAMFLKLTFLESIGRVPLFEQYPPIRIWVYSFRQSVAKNGDPEDFKKSSAVCYAWFIWKEGFDGHPEIRWIKPDMK